MLCQVDAMMVDASNESGPGQKTDGVPQELDDGDDDEFKDPTNPECTYDFSTILAFVTTLFSYGLELRPFCPHEPTLRVLDQSSRRTMATIAIARVFPNRRTAGNVSSGVQETP
jgi:hypothetical protein